MGGATGILGGLAFAAPWVLAGLIALPLVWWLLRALPPPPRRLAFPTLAILRRISVEETTPARPPWPLLALRLALFTAVILALSGPRIDPGILPAGEGPLTIIVDDGWASAPHWALQQEALADVLDAAASDGIETALITTAPTQNGAPAATVGRLADIRSAVAALAPKPWPADRTATLKSLTEAGLIDGRRAIWLSDGADTPDALSLAAAFGPRLTVWRPDPATATVLLRAPKRAGVGLELVAERATSASAAAETIQVRAVDANGAGVARAEIAFAAGAQTGKAALNAPVETMNRIARLEVSGRPSAGAVYLLDSAWARRRVGIVQLAEGGWHPLLDPTRYLIEALEPFAEIETGSSAQLIEAGVDAILLTDIAGADPETRADLETWTRDGGLLVRFAGPLLAETPDSLTPTPLRPGGRALGGPMSWSKPLGLAPLPTTGPLAGLKPPPGVAVARQALAEPGPELAKATWAALADGTPLVTGTQLDDGLLALVHVDAGPDWSDLPISGFFVEMLRRLTTLATSRGAAQLTQDLAPLSALDGFGRLQPAGAGLDRLPAEPERPSPRPSLPPGYYGPDTAPVAFNLGAGLPPLERLASLPRNGAAVYGAADVIRLTPWLLLAAALLLLAELLLTLAYSGRMPRLNGMGARRTAAGAAVLACLASLAISGEARADSAAAAIETRIAYIETGDAYQDRKSQLGVAGLVQTLRNRTSVEPGPPLAIDIERDEIVLLALIYWPVTPNFPALSGEAKAKLARYLSTGGMILFDTGDADRSQTLAPLGQATPEARALQRILADTPVPPLMPMPLDHVLGRAFYLLDQFPGRTPGGQVWVERSGSSAFDGVTSIIIGGADWAGAWAEDERGAAVYPVSPNGRRQRELALRFGVNVVMHALTGNYKGDQVHLPLIMERLGQ